MKLTVSKRSGDKKSELTWFRYHGDIPAVTYSKENSTEKIVVKGAEFSAVLRSISKGYLPVTVFELDDGNSTRKAIVKDIQYHPTTYKVLHLDFLILSDDISIDVNVPVVYQGEAECAGVKLGGFVRSIKRHVKVRCLPQDIPLNGFSLDISDLNIGQSKKVGDITHSSGVNLQVAGRDILVVVAKR